MSFRIDSIGHFMALASRAGSPKLIDQDRGIAFFFSNRQQIEYAVKDKSEADQLVASGFVSGKIE